MVYYSVPDPNITYPPMPNFELTKFEIHDATFTPYGLINTVNATVTSAYSLEMTFTRAEVLEFMKKQANGFYFKGKKLILDKIGLDQFVHFDAGSSCADCRRSEPRDILE